MGRFNFSFVMAFTTTQNVKCICSKSCFTNARSLAINSWKHVPNKSNPAELAF